MNKQREKKEDNMSTYMIYLDLRLIYIVQAVDMFDALRQVEQDPMNTEFLAVERQLAIDLGLAITDNRAA